MSLRLALSLALLVFLATLLARFPAKAAAGLLPRYDECLAFYAAQRDGH